MPISLKLKDNELHIKIISSPAWGDDKAKLAKINPRIPIYIEDDFSHWEVPLYNLEKILNLWDKDQIIVDKEAAKLLNKQDFDSIPIKDLPRHELLLYPKNKIPFDYQIDFAGITADKSRIICAFLMGFGKCFKLDTLILMYDGSIKKVQDVVVDDLLMGPDSKPRRVTSLARGREEMYKVIPVKGEPWICNKSHILSLKRSGNSYVQTTNIKKNPKPIERHGDILNISIEDFLKRTEKFEQNHWLLYRTGVEFKESLSLEIDPYFLGLWLGDGHSNSTGITTMDPEIVSYVYFYAKKLNMHVRVQESKRPDGSLNKSKDYFITLGNNGKKVPNTLYKSLQILNLFHNKHIPQKYKINSREVRLEVLAGILDTDGSYIKGGGGYDYISKLRILAEDVVFICRSLGLAANLKECIKGCWYKEEYKSNTYYRVHISGDIDQIPCKLPRKQAEARKQKKSVLVTNFKLELLGEDDYYGFEIEGPDRLFLLGDFTVVHNSLTSYLRALNIGYERLLILCPETVKATWQTSLWENYEEKSFVYEGTIKQRAKRIQELDAHEIIITNYEKIKDLLTLPAGYFDHIIIDEIHNFSNADTKIYKDCQKLIAKNPDAIYQGLSGSPMRHHLKDLWGCLALFWPSRVGSMGSFLSKYEEVLFSIKKRIIEKTEKGTKSRLIDIPIKTKPKNEDQLRKLLSTMLIRYKGEESEDKNPIKIIPLPITARQKQLYETCRTEILLELENKTLKLGNALTRMLRLLQIGEGEFNINPLWKESAKLDYIYNKIETYPGKIVIWSRFRPITHIIHEKYPNESVIFNGKINSNLRKLAVWAFSGVGNEKDEEEYYRIKKRYPDFKFNPGEARIFPATYGMRSGLGIDGLQVSHYQIFPSFDWNGNTIMQARARLIRLGQLDEVLSEILVAEETIEGRALRMILGNYANVSRTIDGQGNIEYNKTKALIGLLR